MNLPVMAPGRKVRPRHGAMRTGRGAILLLSIIGAIALTAFVLLSSQTGATCGAFLGLRQQKDVRLECQLVSNGIELTSYRCPAPQGPGLGYSGASALLVGPEGTV